MDPPSLPIPPGRGIYCNRTLNLRSVRAIGYDMDYTLIHYNVEEWERCAYEFLRDKLLERGWPIGDLAFGPGAVIRGLIIDRELGNIVKADRFGYVKRAVHGSRMLTHDEQRAAYSRAIVDLTEDRWRFLNTFFSLSEACLYAQLVDLFDAGGLPGVFGYADLHSRVRTSLDETHMDGALKARILADPKRFVVDDEQTPRALLDQKEAGKKLLLITNSEWAYTCSLMAYAFDRFLPDGIRWRDLFDLIVVAAGKPEFFFERKPIFEVVDESGLLRPVVGKISVNRGSYLGGNASIIEEGLGLDGSGILFVGDHIFSDVHVSKAVRRWRTAVIVREIEPELEALELFGQKQRALESMMATKEELERRYSLWRIELQRRRRGHRAGTNATDEFIQTEMSRLHDGLVALDDEITPLARAAGALANNRWGLIMRTGSDKSHLARQIERHADIYTSRVSNFLFETPFAYFRSHRGSLPHDYRLSGSPDANDI